MPSSEEMEQVIRDKAGEVISLVRTRRDHPTYGITKMRIAATVEQMEGMIGMYMVVTDQAAHANIPSLAKFITEDTAIRVESARAEARGA